MKPKLGVGIPTYNRYDILEPTLRKYSVDFQETEIYIVDNGHQSISITQKWDVEQDRTQSVKVIENKNNVGVGASWNQLCKLIFDKYEYALILNDDIYFGKSYSRVIELIDKKKPKFIRATPDWCVFLLHKSVYEEVGFFDECFFPAYYEDKSYEYRMRLKGVPILKHPELNPTIYQSSKTLEKEPTLIEASKKNKKLYIEMWGGEPSKEKYLQPFNNYKKNKNEVL